MKLKTLLRPIIEKCSLKDESNLVALLGVEGALKDLVEYERHVNADSLQVDKNATFENLFGFDTKFYYQLMVFKDDIVQQTEIGLACLIKENDSILIKRLMPLGQGNKDGQRTASTGFITNVNPDDYTHIHIASYSIQNVMQVMVDPDTVPVASAVDGITPIYLENETCLAKVDNRIQALPLKDIFSLKSCAENIVSAIGSYAKKISIKSSSFFCRRIESNCLVLHKSDNKEKPEGSLVYDNKSKSLKFYDGTIWRSLALKEDSENTK